MPGEFQGTGKHLHTSLESFVSERNASTMLHRQIECHKCHRPTLTQPKSRDELKPTFAAHEAQERGETAEFVLLLH